MIIELQSIGIPLSEAIREHVRRRVARAIQPFLSRVHGVTIVLEGLQFSSMPSSQHCWVSLVSARTQREIVVHGSCSDIGGAIRKATQRLRVALTSELQAAHSVRGWRLDGTCVADGANATPPSHLPSIRLEPAAPWAFQHLLPRPSPA
jgi:ribosome-associated translation inhibitor RaiA